MVNLHRKPDGTRTPFQARFAVMGVLSLAAAIAAARGPGLVNQEFTLPSGVDAEPYRELHDGTYVGAPETIPSGDVQVTATVQGGRITQLHVDWPRGERHSRVLNDNAVPILADEALRAQTYRRLNFVTGATNTSRGFTRSLQDALNQAARS